MLTVKFEAGTLLLRAAGKDQSHERWSCGLEHEVPMEDKIQLCATLADTRLFLYTGTWTSLGPAQQQALHGPRMHILRRATNMYRSGENDKAIDREVLVAAGCYTIDVQVAMLRLLFFARLVRWGTTPLFAVLQAGDGHVSSWTTALRRDLAWLYNAETRGVFYDFSDPHNGDCSVLVTFALDKPAQWKTRVKRAAKMSILSLEAFPVSGFPVQPAEMLSCADCGKVCRGMGGLRAHQFRVHGKRCESRLFAFGSVCRWCMTDFRTRPRLIMHFRKHVETPGKSTLRRCERACSISQGRNERRWMIATTFLFLALRCGYPLPGCYTACVRRNDFVFQGSSHLRCWSRAINLCIRKADSMPVCRRFSAANTPYVDMARVYSGYEWACGVRISTKNLSFG